VPVSVLPPITAAPLTTVIDVAVEVIGALSVVCWAFEEYFLVVIYLPIGCSGRELDIAFVVFGLLHLIVVYIEQRVVWLQIEMNRMDVWHLSHQPVG
jgi:hypothetical protein